MTTAHLAAIAAVVIVLILAYIIRQLRAIHALTNSNLDAANKRLDTALEEIRNLQGLVRGFEKSLATMRAEPTRNASC